MAEINYIEINAEKYGNQSKTERSYFYTQNNNDKKVKEE